MPDTTTEATVPDTTTEATASTAGGSSAFNRPDVRRVLATAVLAVPGVVRLEPTLSTAGPGVLLRNDPADGLHLLLRPGSADVDINIATGTAHQARAVAHQIHAVVASTLALHGHKPGAVTVSVLTIEA